jgi:hypothetical protein
MKDIFGSINMVQECLDDLQETPSWKSHQQDIRDHFRNAHDINEFLFDYEFPHEIAHFVMGYALISVAQGDGSFFNFFDPDNLAASVNEAYEFHIEKYGELCDDLKKDHPDEAKKYHDRARALLDHRKTFKKVIWNNKKEYFELVGLKRKEAING